MIMIGVFFEFKELGTSAIDPHILFHPPRSYLHSMVGDSSDRVLPLEVCQTTSAKGAELRKKRRKWWVVLGFISKTPG